MSWAAWRLQRTETILTAAIAVILAAVLVPVGLHMASVYNADHISVCAGAQNIKQNFTCARVVGDFLQRFEGINPLIGWFNLIPGLVGVLVAAPLLLELENGTFRFAWTQSVTRRRWIAGKLGAAVAVALLAALALSQLVTWFHEPWIHLNGRLDTNVFDFAGTVDYAYVLFALGLALTIGVLVRRAVPALIVGFISYVVARVFCDTWLRQRLLTPDSATWKSNTPGPDLNHAWVLSQGPSDRLGNVIGPIFHGAVGAAPCGKGQPCTSITITPPGNYMHAVFFPASRFWAFQGVETAMFGGIALALILFAAWWIHERVA